MTSTQTLAATALLPALALGAVQVPAEGPVSPAVPATTGSTRAGSPDPASVTAGDSWPDHAPSRATGDDPRAADGLGRATVPGAGRSVPSATTAPGTWAWPLTPRPHLVRAFALGPSPWSPGHRGVDLAAGPGATVHSPAAGVVRFSGVIAGRPVLSIDHGHGLFSSFEPVSTDLRAGMSVARGTTIGRVWGGGPNHCLPQVCLHWGVRREGRYLNPLLMIAAAGPAVLLPIGPPAALPQP